MLRALAPLAAAFVMIAAGCGAGASVDPTPSDAWLSEQVEYVRFSHPADWSVQLPRNEVVLGGSPDTVFYVATMEVGPECVGGRCGIAIPPLEPGDIVIQWQQLCCRSANLPAGPPFLVDGFEGRIDREAFDAVPCSQEDVAAWVAFRTGQTVQFATLCSRGLDTGDIEALFDRFIASIDLAPFR